MDKIEHAKYYVLYALPGTLVARSQLLEEVRQHLALYPRKMAISYKWIWDMVDQATPLDMNFYRVELERHERRCRVARASAN